MVPPLYKPFPTLIHPSSASSSSSTSTTTYLNPTIPRSERTLIPGSYNCPTTIELHNIHTSLACVACHRMTATIYTILPCQHIYCDNCIRTARSYRWCLKLTCGASVDSCGKEEYLSYKALWHMLRYWPILQQFEPGFGLRR